MKKWQALHLQWALLTQRLLQTSSSEHRPQTRTETRWSTAQSSRAPICSSHDAQHRADSALRASPCARRRRRGSECTQPEIVTMWNACKARTVATQHVNADARTGTQACRSSRSHSRTLWRVNPHHDTHHLAHAKHRIYGFVTRQVHARVKQPSLCKDRDKMCWKQRKEYEAELSKGRRSSGNKAEGGVRVR
eukprot:3432234-Pleurochrysis_carterae.AAC.1